MCAGSAISAESILRICSDGGRLSKWQVKMTFTKRKWQEDRTWVPDGQAQLMAFDRVAIVDQVATIEQ
jgi:hypothetical protein